MQLTSLISILSASIKAFTDEAASDSSNSFHLDGDSGYYLTFENNEGNAQLCPSITDGYRTFVISEGTQDSAKLQVSNANNHLCPSEEYSTGENGLKIPTYNITLCSQGDLSPIYFNLNGNANGVYIFFEDDQETIYQAFWQHYDGFGCSPITFAYATYNGNPWQALDLTES